jgi:hypothetical protein
MADEAMADAVTAAGVKNERSRAFIGIISVLASH